MLRPSFGGCALVAALLGCAPATTGVNPAMIPWASSPPTRYVHSDSITLWLYAPKSVARGDSVPMRLELENSSARGWLTVMLGGRVPHADFVIATVDGTEIWSIYRDLELLMNQDPRRLDVGERIVFPYTWGQETFGPVRPGPLIEAGEYQLFARIRLGDEMVTTTARPIVIR